MCNIPIDIIIWCINWIKTELHILHYTNGSLWYNYFQNWVIVSSLTNQDTTQSNFSTDCEDMPTTRYDRETLCDPITSLPIALRFQYLTDWTVMPATAYNLDWTAYVWAISWLVSCGWGKRYDFEDTLMYDNCVAIMQTIVRETSNANNIETIFYTKLNWTVHTLIWPLSDKPCTDPDRTLTIITDCLWTTKDINVQWVSPIEVVLTPSQELTVKIDKSCDKNENAWVQYWVRLDSTTPIQEVNTSDINNIMYDSLSIYNMHAFNSLWDYKPFAWQDPTNNTVVRVEVEFFNPLTWGNYNVWYAIPSANHIIQMEWASIVSVNKIAVADKIDNDLSANGNKIMVKWLSNGSAPKTPINLLFTFNLSI